MVLLAIVSNGAQPRIPIDKEEKRLTATPIFNKASIERRPLQLRDQELIQDSTINLEGELIHSALIAEAELVEFEKIEEINSIEKNHTWELMDPPSNKKPIALKWVYKVKINPRGEVMKNKAKLMAKGTPTKVGLSLKKETDEEQVDLTHYKMIVGCLRFMQEPKQSHLLDAKRILRYVQGMIDFGILFTKEEVAAKPELVGYTDSDWCEDKRDRKNTTWYIFFYGRAPISWSYTKEHVVALSSYEAEYITTSELACQGQKNSKKVKLLVDNKSTINLARHSPSHGRSKHIGTRFHFLREQINNEKLQIEYCRTKIQFADIKS
ncbi:Copia protein, partial [Mucuna pruriens]